MANKIESHVTCENILEAAGMKIGIVGMITF